MHLVIVALNYARLVCDERGMLFCALVVYSSGGGRLCLPVRDRLRAVWGLGWVVGWGVVG